MKFITLKKAKHLGVADIHVNGKIFFTATYAGYAITKLFTTEEEAVEAAKHLMVSLRDEPILGIVGFDLSLALTRDDKICFSQIVETDLYERSLVVGTERGVLTDILHWDTRDVHIQDTDIEYGMKLGHVLAVYEKALRKSA